MKKILIISAIVTWCIAPAIFAATQYIGYNATTTKSENSSSWKQASKVSDPVKLCLQWVMKEFTKDKRKASDTYKKNMKTILQKKDTWIVVSWEKSLKLEKIQSVQNEYRESLLALKDKYSLKQQACAQK